MASDSIATRLPDLAADDYTAEVLDLTAHDIDGMAMSDRLEFVRVLGHHGQQLGAADAWRRLEGVVAFFDAAGLGAPGTWLSRVNAKILEAVARGIVITDDAGADDYGNPGARAWADYLALFTAGPSVGEPNAAAAAWSWARRVSVDAGRRWASHCGAEPTAHEQRFLVIADACNLAVAHRPMLDLLVTYAGVLGPSLAGIDPAIVDRLCDPADADTARRGCEIAYAAATLNPDAACGTQEHRLLPVIRGMLDALATHP
ncbi:hypothetical protein [Nocardia wallacei]|uniref:hypothetical protein n=1 Tax=Nocardia wallacei TaxID=480035 RepID=UPI00245649BB|nr:hypothetical protein [Nocardia wallacei]